MMYKYSYQLLPATLYVLSSVLSVS